MKRLKATPGRLLGGRKLLSGPRRTFARWFVEVTKASLDFAGFPPELRMVSKLVKIKCDLIFGCKIYLIFVVNYFIFQC